MIIHVDTDFLIYALSRSGAERNRLRRAAESEAVLQISAVAWYEFSRAGHHDGAQPLSPLA